MISSAPTLGLYFLLAPVHLTSSEFPTLPPPLFSHELDSKNKIITAPAAIRGDVTVLRLSHLTWLRGGMTSLYKRKMQISGLGSLTGNWNQGTWL